MLAEIPWSKIFDYFFIILGLYLSIAFYYKQKRDKKPVYKFVSYQLIGKHLSGDEKIELKFDGKPIKHLITTKFSFWNLGKDPIRRSDLSTIEPLKIGIQKGMEILEYRILHLYPSNDIKVEVINNQIQITFEYLEKDQGVAFEFKHNSEHERFIELSGVVIGAEIKHIDKVRLNLIDAFTGGVGSFLDALIKNKNFGLKAIGLIIFFPTIFLLMPFAVIGAVYRPLHESVNRIPEHFSLD